MTLPFRRRHHDDEATHDRARALTSREMLEPLGEDDTTWLARHLDGCGECRSDREAYLGDRELLRSLRDRSPEPPRDLWARTSAALDREARNRSRRGAGARARGARADRRGAGFGGWQGLPLGAAAGVLIMLVVIGASIVPPVVPPAQTAGASAVVVATPDSQPTPIAVADAGPVGWIQPGAGGSWDLFISNVGAVCPRARPACRPGALGQDDRGRPVDLGGMPTGVTISPNENQLVVQAGGENAQSGRIFVVPVPSVAPEGSPGPTIKPTEPPATAVVPTEPAATDPAATEPAVTEPAPTGLATTNPASPAPSPGSSPANAIEIASGVTIVGEATYSKDGRWLAFSAKPSDGSTGPDLYLWSVGTDAAVAVTTDHQTYFSSWLDGQVLASRVEVVASPGASPGASPAASSGATTPSPAADPTTAPVGASDAPAQPLEGHPISFLLDPATLARTEIAQPDVWLPVVDADGRFVAYWSGTLRAVPGGTDWQLGTGSLVLDGWSSEAAAGQSPGPSVAATVEPGAASGEPGASPPDLGPAIGPVGTPAPLVAGDTASFQAKFDPTGTRLAVWVGEQADATVGRLHLLVLDPDSGAIDAELAPLPGVPALRRFSIDKGRLAWVSPSGQDGQESAVQVLGWSRDNFGGIQTIPARDLFIVR